MNTSTNLLLITSDQQQWFTLGVNNPQIKTPNLDRLAAMGTNFTRAYCPNPTCTPTRASIITGMYPSAHGAFTLGTKLAEHHLTVGDVLRDAGYDTVLVGKAHFQPLFSSDESLSVESYPRLRDLDFWRRFNDTHTPWYGFDHVELTRNHADEGHVGQHYAIWMEENGLPDWRKYFQLRGDGIRDSHDDATLAPADEGDQGHGWRTDMTWKLPEEFHYTAWTGQRTNDAISRAHERGHPFFVWSSYHDPHPPYCVPEPWASMYRPEDMKVGRYVDGEFDDMPPVYRMTREHSPDFESFNLDGKGNHGYASHARVSEQDLQEAQACYFGMISFMDHWIGRTLDHLEDLGLLDNTMIVFTSDHGHFLGEHGLIAKGPFHYEEVIRVPLLATWPGHIPAGVESSAIQSLVDLAPTFLAAAGLGTPRAMQGLAQADAWSGRAEPPRDHAIVENHHNASDAVHLRTLVTDRHKLTVYRGRDWGELFDLAQDPSELCNLYEHEGSQGLRADMLNRLVQADLEREPAPMPRVAGA